MKCNFKTILSTLKVAVYVGIFTASSAKETRIYSVEFANFL